MNNIQKIGLQAKGTTVPNEDLMFRKTKKKNRKALVVQDAEEQSTTQVEKQVSEGNSIQEVTAASKLTVPEPLQDSLINLEVEAAKSKVKDNKKKIAKRIKETIAEQTIKQAGKKRQTKASKVNAANSSKPSKIEGAASQNVAQKVIQNIDADKDSEALAVNGMESSTEKSTSDIPVNYVQTAEVIEEINNVSLDGVDVPEMIEDIGAAIETLPESVSIKDLEVKPSKIKKDKHGYFKTKVNIKKSNIPEIVNKIASYVKQHSKGLIKPRVCDLRVIGNTNKTQLRNSDLKLSAATVVFKPDFTKFKVNKGTRFMISVPDNHEATGNLLIYIQESRAKTILEITPKDFVSNDVFMEFIGDRIAEYYYYGYDVTLRKLQLRGTDNPYMRIISIVLNTKDYKAKTYADEENSIYCVDFKSNGAENQWLHVRLIESDIQGLYDVIAVNTVDTEEYHLIDKPQTLKYFEDNIITILNKTYARDWSAELNITDTTTTLMYQSKKLKHYKLRKVLFDIYGLMENRPDVEVKNVLSRRDMIKLQKSDYDAEAIVGKTDKLEWFVITYLAYLIIGGDARLGRNYITRQQYYQRYSVKDRSEYEKRKRTILTKQDAERNYNARPYVFQVEYKSGEKVNVVRAKTFEEILKLTNLFDTPNMNAESPIK